MSKVLFGLILIVILPGLVAAQKQNGETNKVEIFTGYSGAALFTGDEFEAIENGFNVAAVYNVHRYVGIKADASGTYKKLEGNFRSVSSLPSASLGRWSGTHSLYNAAVGVQFKDNRRETTAKPFGHILVGYGKHSDKFKTACPPGALCPPLDINFKGVSLIIGAGLDVKINRRIDIRVIQFDLNPISYSSEQRSSVWLNNRFSSGIVFKF